VNFHQLKQTAYIRIFGLLKIPLIAFLRPTVVELSDQRCVIRFPLRRRAQNHLKSMYFGALCIGADCAGGAIAMQRIHQSGEPVQFVFKDFQANFRKRADGDVLFTFEEGDKLNALVQRASTSGRREEDTVHVVATVPDKYGDEPVADFTLTISLKRKTH
jgi:acyl-coenzyme A thioesterase PaaI-like protein